MINSTQVRQSNHRRIAIAIACLFSIGQVGTALAQLGGDAIDGDGELPPVEESATADAPVTTTASSTETLLAPGNREFFAGLHMGGAINLSDAPSQFALVQEAGWHFMQPGSGPAIGVMLSESFGDSAFVFRFAPKAWWFWQPLASIGFYVVPSLHMGLFHLSVDVPDIPGLPAGFSIDASQTGFNWGFGAQGRLILANRFYVMFQPFALDFMHASGGTGIRWDLLFAGGATF